MNKKIIYLDNNATTPLHPEVKKTILDSLDLFGNASSFHVLGRDSRKQIELSREKIASFINCTPDELIFLGSGSEANNTVLNIFVCTSPMCQHNPISKRAIVTSKIEHPCVLETAKCLNERGKKVFYIDVDEKGRIRIDKLEEILKNENIGIVSIMMANNEVGTIQDIKAITKLAHRYGAFMHTDAVQAIGKIDVDIKDLDIDFLSLSAHKIYGPKGIGALFIKKGIPFCPFIRGGHQEKGRRAGTENTIGIIGFGKAIECLKNEMHETKTKILKLKNKLKSGILNSIEKVQINGDQDNCLFNTLNISFLGAEGESILLYLDLEGICVSTGSACSSGSLDPSHVLLSMGVDSEKAHGSIRFSLGRETTEEDIEIVLKKLPVIIKKIRDMSTIDIRSL